LPAETICREAMLAVAQSALRLARRKSSLKRL
jgi:hypothetical protein